jgi:hypothetical protein
MKLRSHSRGLGRAALASTLLLVLAACTTPPASFTLAVSVTGTGSVTSNPVGIDTSTANGAQADFADGTTVTLTATAGAGSSFTGWGGACAGTMGTACEVTMDAAKSASATFGLIVGSLDLSITGLPVGATASVQITGPNAYDETFTSNATVALPPGAYTVVPASVSNAPAIYRARPQTVSVVASATANVTVAYERPSVLFYYDFINTADNMTPALEANGFAVTFTNVTATFNTEVSNGGHDLVIVMVQGNAPAFDVPAFAAYVDGGGRAIGADWSETAGFATVFDASFTGATNLTTADLEAPALADGVTNPLTLDLSFWGVSTTGLSAAVGSASLCTFENADSCLVSGNEGRTALLGFVMDAVPATDAQTFWENLSLHVLDY